MLAEMDHCLCENPSFFLLQRVIFRFSYQNSLKARLCFNGGDIWLPNFDFDCEGQTAGITSVFARVRLQRKTSVLKHSITDVDY